MLSLVPMFTDCQSLRISVLTWILCRKSKAKPKAELTVSVTAKTTTLKTMYPHDTCINYRLESHETPWFCIQFVLHFPWLKAQPLCLVPSPEWTQNCSLKASRTYSPPPPFSLRYEYLLYLSLCMIDRSRIRNNHHVFAIRSTWRIH